MPSRRISVFRRRSDQDVPPLELEELLELDELLELEEPPMPPEEPPMPPELEPEFPPAPLSERAKAG
ncbi:hypothetical protein CO674_13475 [Rhizobium hidalgonense]|uniref:Uncharacterized protein n=1 Tax=Rhizobium hidalgonense TaxID=1538159 RepID=A0ABX4JSR0_9HYPH|nr:hypothetical protein CO674_13475 [Rhizobium hidalgonense]